MYSIDDDKVREKEDRKVKDKLATFKEMQMDDILFPAGMVK